MYLILKAIVGLEVLWQCNVWIHCIENSVFYKHHIHNTFGGTLKGYKRSAAMNPVLLVFLNIDPQECLVHFVWLPGTAEYRQLTHWRCCKQTAVLILQYSSTSLLCLLPLCTFALSLFEPSSYENLSDCKTYKKVSDSAVRSCLLPPRERMSTALTVGQEVILTHSPYTAGSSHLLLSLLLLLLLFLLFLLLLVLLPTQDHSHQVFSLLWALAHQQERLCRAEREMVKAKSHLTRQE